MEAAEYEHMNFGAFLQNGMKHLDVKQHEPSAARTINRKQVLTDDAIILILKKCGAK